MAKASQQSSSRSEARETATGAGQTAGTGRRPKPDDNTAENNGQVAEGQAAGDQAAASEFNPELHSLIVVAPHDKAKRAGTKAYAYYQGYPPVGQMSDIFKTRKGEYCKGITYAGTKIAEVRGKDISFDMDPTRRFILIGKDALAFDAIAKGEPFGANRAASAQFLLNEMKVPEKILVKWGYMDPPAPAAEQPATEQAKVPEPA